MPPTKDNNKPQYTIEIPQPEERQIEVLNDPAQFKIIAAGRRWGKTVTGLIAAVIGHGPIQEDGLPLYPGAVYGRKIWWVAPTYTTLSDIWRNLKEALKDATIYKNENEHRVDIPGGGSITVRSTESYDNLRGPGVDGMLLDEAAYINGMAWTRVLNPMLLDRNGWAIFMSTPNGRNWWYDLYERVPERPKWRRWHAPSTDNPRMTPQAVAEVKEDPNLTEADFQQEYMAQFNAPGINSFKEEWFKFFTFDSITNEYVLQSKFIDPTTQQEMERRYNAEDIFKFGTVDLAISTKERADWTVMQIWGITPDNDLLLIHQTRDRMENPEQLATLISLYEEFRPHYFAIERTGYQLALIQQARQQGIPCDELRADKDKVSRASVAVTRMAAGKMFFDQTQPYFDSLKEEILGFPHSKFDDQVDALAYAAIKLSQKPKKMLLDDIHLGNEVIFSLPDYTNLPFHFANMPETTGTSNTLDQIMLDRSIWFSERGPIVLAESVETMMFALSTRFQGDHQTLWHAHVALSRTGENAAIALGKISRWDSLVGTVENSPYVTQVPMFSIPLLMKIGSPLSGPVNAGVLTDFLIAIKGVRGFNITSASVTGIKSATAVQKLTRANIAVLGLKINPETGIPMGLARQNTESDQQPYVDLKLAIESNRLEVVDSEFLRHELSQIEETGKTLAHDATTAEAVAHTVGFLARHGHQIMEQPQSDYVSLQDAGFEVYTGLRDGYYD